MKEYTTFYKGDLIMTNFAIIVWIAVYAMLRFDEKMDENKEITEQ